LDINHSICIQLFSNTWSVKIRSNSSLIICIKLAIGNSMNIKSPESLKPHTPSLKRTQLQHSSLKSCPRLSTTPSLPFRDNKSIMSVAMLNSFDSGESQLLKSNTF